MDVGSPHVPSKTVYVLRRVNMRHRLRKSYLCTPDVGHWGCRSTWFAFVQPLPWLCGDARPGSEWVSNGQDKLSSVAAKDPLSEWSCRPGRLQLQASSITVCATCSHLDMCYDLVAELFPHPFAGCFVVRISHDLLSKVELALRICGLSRVTQETQRLDYIIYPFNSCAA